MLFSPQELQALLDLLNRTPMSQAERLFTQGFFQRLVAACQPEPTTEIKENEDAKAE